MKKYFKDNIKFVLGIIVGILLSGTTVYAAILYASSDVSYDNTNSGLSATNVQSALDELYNNHSCSTYSGPISDYLLGKYISMTPDSTSYSISTSLTGYSSNQTINPSELNLWRIIKVNEDGSVDAVSEYVSSTEVFFEGTQGYAKYINTLQTIASQYKKEGYTKATRMMGYDGQTMTINDTSQFNGTSFCNSICGTNCLPLLPNEGGAFIYKTELPTSGTGIEYLSGIHGDTLYLKDYILVSSVYDDIRTTSVNSTNYLSYWLASRAYEYNKYVSTGANRESFGGRSINNEQNTLISSKSLVVYIGSRDDYSFNSVSNHLRPIITLKASVNITGGNGTKNNPYILQ